MWIDSAEFYWNRSPRVLQSAESRISLLWSELFRFHSAATDLPSGRLSPEDRHAMACRVVALRDKLSTALHAFFAAEEWLGAAANAVACWHGRMDASVHGVIVHVIWSAMSDFLESIGFEDESDNPDNKDEHRWNLFEAEEIAAYLPDEFPREAFPDPQVDFDELNAKRRQEFFRACALFHQRHPPKPHGDHDTNQTQPQLGPIIKHGDVSVLSVLQQAILEALDGKGLMKESLAEALKVDPSRLYRRGGIGELKQWGMIRHQRGVGYYRPDAPPPGAIELRPQVAPEEPPTSP